MSTRKLWTSYHERQRAKQTSAFTHVFGVLYLPENRLLPVPLCQVDLTTLRGGGYDLREAADNATTCTECHARWHVFGEDNVIRDKAGAIRLRFDRGWRCICGHAIDLHARTLPICSHNPPCACRTSRTFLRQLLEENT